MGTCAALPIERYRCQPRTDPAHLCSGRGDPSPIAANSDSGAIPRNLQSGADRYCGYGDRRIGSGDAGLPAAWPGTN